VEEEEEEEEDACQNTPLDNVVLGGFCSKHTFSCLKELLGYVDALSTVLPNVKRMHDAAVDYAEKRRKKGSLKFGASNHRKFYMNLLHELRLQHFRQPIVADE